MNLLCLFKHRWQDYDDDNLHFVYPRRICTRCLIIQVFSGPMYGWVKL